MTPVEEMKQAIEKVGTNYNELKTLLTQRDEEVKKHGKELGETKQAIDKCNEALGKAVDFKERIDQLEAAFKRGVGSEAEQKKAKLEERSIQVKGAYEQYFRKLDGSKINDIIANAEFKDLSVGSTPDGGYTVYPDMNGRLVKRVYETSPMRQLASVMTLTKSDTLIGIADIDETDVAWTGETQAPSTSRTPQIVQYRIQAHEMSTEPKATNQILEDSGIDIEAWLISKIGDKFARGENTAFVLGDGVARPRGFCTYAHGTTWGTIEQINSGSAAVITADGLIRLIYSLKQDYRARANFVMQRATVGSVRLLKDSQGRYLWAPGLEAGQPSSLLGFNVTEFADMAAEGAGLLPIGFGDFNTGYQIVDRLGTSILRDPFTGKPFVKFYARRRVGGDVVNFEAIKLQKCSA